MLKECSRLVVSASLQPRGLQPSRLPRPREILRRCGSSCLEAAALLPAGSLRPAVLLPDAVEAPGRFATIENLHEPAGHELARDE